MSYLKQPDIDPVIINLWGPLQLRWYSVLYVGAFLVARALLKKLSREDRFDFTAAQIEQFIVWALVGAVIGARVFYCFVYDPQALLENPLYLFQTYKGGLSFHGGILGVIIAAWIFCRKNSLSWVQFCDAICLSSTIGLGMGRLGNFINGELWGRPSTVPWAMVFKADPTQLPRHPSQLYEFLLEGVLLTIVLWALKNKLSKNGQISMVFLLGYSASRFIVEFFREPDPQLGYLALGLSMGQWLSIIMAVVSVIGVRLAVRLSKS